MAVISTSSGPVRELSGLPAALKPAVTASLIVLEIRELALTTALLASDDMLPDGLNDNITIVPFLMRFRRLNGNLFAEKVTSTACYTEFSIRSSTRIISPRCIINP